MTAFPSSSTDSSVATRAPPAPSGYRPAALFRALGGYLLLLPAAALMALVLLYPIVGSIINSVTQDGRFIGTESFRTVFSDPVFWQSFKNNLILLVSIPVRLVLGLAIVAVLYRGIYGSRLYQLLVFLPFIPSIAAIGVVFIYLLNFSGPFNEFLRVAGLGFLAHGWLTEENLSMWTIMAVVVWTRLGFTVLLLMARLLTVDRSIFQAAFIDGASWPRAFWHVGIPQLRGTIEFIVILSFIEAFSWSFAYIYVLTQGANNPSQWILEVFLYNKEFLTFSTGLASAVAVVLLLMAGAIALYRYRRFRLEAA